MPKLTGELFARWFQFSAFCPSFRSHGRIWRLRLPWGWGLLWGRDLLIAPVYSPGATSRTVYLPQGQWYDWWTNTKLDGGQTVRREVDLATMPIYVRAGAIIPFDPVRQYVDQPVAEPTTLTVFSGADGDFTCYEDDGVSLDYLQGQATWTRIQWKNSERRLVIEPGARADASRPGPTRNFKIELLPEGLTRNLTCSGQRIEVTFQASTSD